jgi:hypothetical protein
MTGRSREIDQFVKARWRAFGLSPDDLAEVLGAMSEQSAKANGTGEIAHGRLLQIAAVLGVANGGAQARRAGASNTVPADTLLELRLLRLFRELKAPDTKRMLVQLVEQIAKRQSGPPKETG